MHTTIRALALALVAAFAIGISGASVASAAPTLFHSEVKTTNLHMEQQERAGGLVDEKKFQAGTVTCKTILYEGQSLVETPGSTTLTSSSFSCGMKGLPGSVEVLMGKCAYQILSGEKDANGNLEGAFVLECPAGETINYFYKVGGILK